MNTKIKLLLIPLFFIAVSAFSLIGEKSVNAATYPGFPTTSTLSVISPDGSQNFSVAEGTSNSWTQRILDDNFIQQSYCSTGLVDDLKYNIENSITTYRAVAQYNYDTLGFVETYSPVGWSSGASGVFIYFNNTTDNEIAYYGNAPEYAGYLAPMTSIATSVKAFLSIDNAGNYWLMCNTGSDFGGSSINNRINSQSVLGGYGGGDYLPDKNFGYSYYVSMSTYFPEDYDANPTNPFPPDPPLPPSEFVPNWYISNILDNKGTFHDTNFNTFDANPFLCDEDLAPVLTWSIYRDLDVDVLITTGVQSATAPIEHDFGKAEIDRDYYIIGQYDCGDTDPLQFDEFGVAEFTINRAGSLKVDLFASCVTETFPFIDPNSCFNNLYTVINLLYFGEVQFPSFTYNPACQNLNTIDEWLGLPNNYQVLCNL